MTTFKIKQSSFLRNIASYFIGVFLLAFSLFSNKVFSQEIGVYKTNPYMEKAEALKYIKPDSSIYYFKKSIALYTEEQDTLNLINNLYELSNLYAHTVDYGNSYDGYWEALILADQSKDDFSKANIYQVLGWLYSFYQRDEEALKYFNLSLKIKKELYEQEKIALTYVLSDYFSIVNFHRVNNNLSSAKRYLDSCYLTQNKIDKNTKNFYLEAESGYLEASDNHFNSAIEKLDSARDFFETNDKSYLIIIDYLLGDTYSMMGNTQKSESYYLSSLESSKIFKSHSNYKYITHEALAKLYSKNQNYEKAFYHLNEAQVLNANVFGRKSNNTQHLFEIKDQYRTQKEKELELIREQRIAKLESDDKIWFLQFILMTVVLAFLLVYGLLLFKNLRRKHKMEKKALAQKRELERQKSQEILELKNKELTASALRLIEKEEFITKLKTRFTDNKENLDANTINKMLKTIQSTPSNNWKEFEASFTAINQSFYKNIKERFPDLGQTDRKICALVRLNFSSKDMASLLGISIESVHTSRYRLRKKLNLDRSENLTNFISSI